MANRSNINLVGNTVTGQNLGTGAEVFKCKSGGSNLQFKTISTTGTSLCVINCANQIYISGGSGSGIQTASNGLTKVGTNVVLGGTLTGDTCITISDTTGLYVTGGTTWNKWGVQVTDCNVIIGDTCSDLGVDSFIGIGGGLSISVKGSDNNINICNFGTNGNVCVRAANGFVDIEGGDGIRLCNLSAKTTETCGLYISAQGKLSAGVISGGTGTNYWSRTGTTVFPATFTDEVMLQSGCHLYWGAAKNVGISGADAATDQINFRLENGEIWRMTGNFICRVTTGGPGLYNTTSANATPTVLPYAPTTNAGLGGTNGTVTLTSNSNIGVLVTTTGGVCLPNLSGKTSETCAVYINSSGKLSYGTISGGISWNGSTVGGIGTYIDSSTICSQPKLKFNNSGLHITGKTYISGLTTGNTSNIIHYDTITHELYTDKLTAGIDGAVQFNDNGVLGGTNLIWNNSVCGFTWGTGYTPTTNNVITIIKTCDYHDGTPTGFISMGIDSEYGQDMFNLCYVSNYPVGNGCSVIQSGIPLHITGGWSGSYLQFNDVGFLLSGEGSHGYVTGNSVSICGSYGVQLNNETWFFDNGIITCNDYIDFCQSSACTYNQITRQNYHNEKFILTNNTTSTTAVLLAYGAAHNQYICLTKYPSHRHHTAMSFDACVTGVEAVSGATVSFFFEGAIKRVSGGTISFVGTPAKVSYKDTVLSTADANVYANNTNKRLDICVCGLTSKNIMWSAVVNSAEIVAIKVP